MSHELLIDVEHLKEFESKGFIKFKLFDKNDCEFLLDEYTKATERFKVSMCSNHFDTYESYNKEFIDYMHQKSIYLLGNKLDGIIKGYRCLSSCLHIKSAGYDSFKSIHQDYSFVDEDRFICANLWIPLRKVNKENGCLFFVPGSHKIGNCRAVNSKHFDFNKHIKEINKRREFVELDAGEAVLFYNGLIHGSESNLSDNDRIAVVYLISQKDADFRLFIDECSNGFIKQYSGLNHDSLVDFFISNHIDTKYYLGENYKGDHHIHIEKFLNNKKGNIISKILKLFKE